jgi:hypothetical protein
MRYGFVASAVPVTAVPDVCVACWLSVTGGWSLSVIVAGTGLFALYGAEGPSAPVLGSGAAAGIPFCDGV